MIQMTKKHRNQKTKPKDVLLIYDYDQMMIKSLNISYFGHLLNLFFKQNHITTKVTPKVSKTSSKGVLRVATAAFLAFPEPQKTSSSRSAFHSEVRIQEAGAE
ncbi:Hypothetical_protein [Hexamita inflata]|uniref:Hypothetical_protein n=1 Tax=Hexamita inflata TaxID=28002 RepID=A0AA86QNQ8_9EUKA|nr:Hypothetical protein HINF_LOCUS42790 [Hexamita inflata]